MSGHSKWSTIKHQKAAADKKRGQAFSRVAKAVTLAAREGADPDKNFKLRLAIEKAKAINTPKANIERAISRGSGEAGGAKIEEIVYEGFGPGSVSIMVEAATDNRNRTMAEIKGIFDKSGGSLAGPGSVAYQFDQVGLILAEKPESVEEALLAIMDMGVENVEESEDGIEVVTRPELLEEVYRHLQTAGYKVISKELSRRPKVLVKISEAEKKTKILRLMETLDDHDDVQEVFANFDFID